MAAPMVINGGHNVAPDSFFDVSLKIKTPTGISIMEEQSFVNVTDSPIKYNNYAFLRTMEFGKTELAAGEETDIKLSFYMPDTPELYNKRFLIVLNLYYEEYYAVIPRPGNILKVFILRSIPQQESGMWIANLSNATYTTMRLE